MRKSKILAKLRAGQSPKFGMLGHFIPPYIAHAAHAGYDGIWLEMEHRPMEAREVQALLAFCHLYDIDCLVRPPTKEKAQLYRFLEDGATGLIIPHVTGLEMARDLVSMTKFPPLGDRGYEGRGLESHFATSNAGDRQTLIQHANRETLLLIQIETLPALEQTEEIAALEGVDGLFIGPADLGIRLALLPEESRPSIEAIMERVNAACQQHGKFWGSMPRSLAEVAAFHAYGARLIPWQNDLAMLAEALQQRSRELDEVFQRG